MPYVANVAQQKHTRERGTTNLASFFKAEKAPSEQCRLRGSARDHWFLNYPLEDSVALLSARIIRDRGICLAQT